MSHSQEYNVEDISRDIEEFWLAESQKAETLALSAHDPNWQQLACNPHASQGFSQENQQWGIALPPGEPTWGVQTAEPDLSAWTYNGPITHDQPSLEHSAQHQSSFFNGPDLSTHCFDGSARGVAGYESLYAHSLGYPDYSGPSLHFAPAIDNQYILPAEAEADTALLQGDITTFTDRNLLLASTAPLPKSLYRTSQQIETSSHDELVTLHNAIVAELRKKAAPRGAIPTADTLRREELVSLIKLYQRNDITWRDIIDEASALRKGSKNRTAQAIFRRFK